MQYLLTTIKNLEDLSLQEFKKGSIAHPGKILLKTSNIEKLIYTSRSIIRVTEVLTSFSFKTIEDILEKLKQTKWKIKAPYRIQCFREGSHNFNSQDIMAEGHKLLKKKVDFKNPKTVIAIEIIDNTCYLGYLKNSELNKRYYKVKTYKQDINSCLAFLLLKIAGYKSNFTLFDPYCGCGTILIESALYSKNITPMHLRNPNKKYDNIKKVKPKLIGFDPFFYNIKNTRINAKLAKVEKFLDLHNCTIDWTETKIKQCSIDAIITHLPRDKEKEFFTYIKNILKPNGIILIVTTKDVLINQKEYKLIDRKTAQIGDTIYTILKCSLKKT